MDRRVICVNIPTLEIALARLEDVSLKTRPVAIAGVGPRSVLREVSSEALSDGVFQGMSVDEAKWLCPSLQVLPPSASRVRRGQEQLQDIVGCFAPVWEAVAPGHVFLDVTGTHRLFGPATDTASRIGAEIAHRSGLAAALGVGTNKLVTQVATGIVQPAELYDVRPGGERRFMAPHAPEVLPELNRPAARTIIGLLHDLNLLNLGSIADVPLAQLHLALGAFADELHLRAQGIDHAPVFPGRARPWRVEALTLEPDEVDIHKIRGSVFNLVERLSPQLRVHQQECRRLRLTVIHTDSVEVSRESDVEPGTCWETDLFNVGEKLLKRALTRRVRVRRVIVEARIAPLPHEQLKLFGGYGDGNIAVPRRPRVAGDRGPAIARTLDRIRNRFGDAAVRWGRATDLT